MHSAPNTGGKWKSSTTNEENTTTSNPGQETYSPKVRNHLCRVAGRSTATQASYASNHPHHPNLPANTHGSTFNLGLSYRGVVATVPVDGLGHILGFPRTCWGVPSRFHLRVCARSVL